MTVQIIEHEPGRDLTAFLDAGRIVFEGDPAWVPPLDMDLRDRLTPNKNPFFEHGKVGLFTAWKDGRLAGRCSTSIDRIHLDTHGDGAGFFGFFDTIDDQEVASALVTRAKEWLGKRGVSKIRGPFSLNVNEEVGILVDGFDKPPFLMMAHSRPYQGALAERAGLAKAKDLYAWRFDVGELPARAERAWSQIQEMPEVTIRSVRRSKMRSELRIIMDIYNDAWSENWGWVPATEEEVRKGADDMRLIIDEDLAFIAEIDGKPVGMCICLPNLNEVIADLDGKLFPTGFAKLLWRVKVKRPKSARLMLLGIKKELRGVKKYGALSMAIYTEIAKRGAAKGYEYGELSWTWEDNHPVNLGIKAMGAKIYKTYRVYEGAL